jgi:hypothetical protein
MTPVHISDVHAGDIYNGKVITYKGYTGRIVHLHFSDGNKMVVSCEAELLIERK